MRRSVIISIVSALMMVPSLLLGQVTPLQKVCDKAIENPGFSSFEMKADGVSIKLDDDESSKEVEEILSSLEMIRVVSYNDSKEEGRSSSKAFYDDLMKAVDKGSYSEGITVIDGSDEIRMFFLKENGSIRELSLIIREETETAIVSMTGDIDLGKMFNAHSIKTLSKMAGTCSKDRHIKVETGE